MPKLIPQYEATAKLETDNLASQSFAQEGYHAERMADIVGRNVDKGIEGIQRGLGVMDEHQAQAQTAAGMSALADATIKAHQNLDTTLNSADPLSGVNPLEKFGGDLNDQLSQIVDSADNPRAREALQRVATETRMNLMDRGTQQWQALTKQSVDQSVMQTANQYANLAIQDPASVDDIAKQYTVSMHELDGAHPGMTSVPDQARRNREGTEGIYNNAAMSVVHGVMSNPNASLADIDRVQKLLAGDNFRNNMSAADYQKVNDDLLRVRSDRADAAALYLNKSFDDAATKDQIVRFGDPTGQFGRMAAAIPKNSPEAQADAAVRVDKYNAMLAEHDVYKKMGNLPSPQVQSFIHDQQTALQNAQSPEETRAASASLEAAMRLSKERDEAFTGAHADPNKWLLANDDGIGALYRNFTADPSPQNFQAFAMHSAARQQTLYPGMVPSVLTSDIKQEVAGRLASVDQTPAGAAAAGQVLSDLQQKTGQFWNEAAHELYKDHIVNGAQFAAAQLMGSPRSWSLAQEGMRAAATPDDILTKTSGITRGAADKVASAALKPLLATFADTTNGHELVASYVDFVSGVMRSRGTVDANTAAALAQTAVLDRFQIKNNLRIPNGLDVNDVADGANNIQANISTHDLVIPPSFSGTGPAVQKDLYVNDIKDFGHWSTNAQGNGMMLYDQYGSPVYENLKGVRVPVTIPFIDAEKVGRNIRSPLNTLSRLVTNPSSVGAVDAGGNLAGAFTAPGAPANSFTEK